MSSGSVTLPAVVLVVVVVMLLSCVVSNVDADNNNVDVTEGDFEVKITGNINVPKYSYQYANGSTYNLQFNQAYEATIATTNSSHSIHKNGQTNVALASLDWSLTGPSPAHMGNVSGVAFNFTSDDTSKKVHWSSINFASFLSNPDHNNDTSHVKLTILINEYEWQEEDDSLVVDLTFTSSGSDQKTFTTDNETYARFGDEGYFSVEDTAYAYDPTGAGATANVNVSMVGSGNSLSIIYSHYPSGYNLVHDPTYGVSTHEDPASFMSNSSSSGGGPHTLLWVGLAVVGAVVVAAVAAAMVVYFLKNRQASGYDAV